MMHRSIPTGRTCVLTALLAVMLASLGAAQASSSRTFFLAASVVGGSGGGCASTKYRATVTIGSSPAAERSISTSFQLLGGFNAAEQVSVAGRPWVTAVRPRFGPLLGGTSHTLHGTELALGLATNVLIGGQTATVSARDRDRVTVNLPKQASPGWQPVHVTNAGGTSVLPGGIGILPLVEKPAPIVIGQPFRVTYRGTKGDIVYVAVAASRLPFAVPIASYHHGLQLNLGTFIGLIGPLPVTSATGEFHLDFPGFAFTRPILVQMLAIPSGTAGYKPGSFTNVIEL